MTQSVSQSLESSELFMSTGESQAEPLEEANKHSELDYHSKEQTGNNKIRVIL